MNCFSNGHSSLNLFKQSNGVSALYKNQIAAIGAAMSHFSTKSDPALIAMPTGTGKTAVMIILSYVFKANKVLVITPSMLVREQITNQFKNPQLLVSKGIIGGDNILPRVYELRGIENNSANWTAIIAENDVVVGIPGTLDQIENIETIIGKDTFDLVFVDEAHHSRAKSWISILKTFSSAKQILLTATPFRRDKKDIKARLIYNYPLKQAFEEKLFSKINLVSVNTTTAASDDEKNIRIAKAAEVVYKGRQHQDHKIIIRTDRKSSAVHLLELYNQHTTLKLDVIHSKLSDRTVRSRIGGLTSGQLDGIICVDMMGEGYDFPALKIAAVHIPHKSLAITLQFVGRISRTNTEEGNTATVVAGEHEFKIESHQLYKTDSRDWSIILPDLHKAKIQKTEEEQEFFDSFEDFSEPLSTDTTNEDANSIDDDDLRPFFHTKVYQIINQSYTQEDEFIDIGTTIDFSGTDALSNPVVTHHHVSTTHDVAVYVVSELKKPKWYVGDNDLTDVQNELFIIYFDRDNSILFISATLKDNELYEHLASQYLKAGIIHDMIPLPILKRVMAGWVEPKMYNVGMKSRKTKGNSESYKNILGSLAQKGVLPSDKYNYTRGHSFGGGYDPIVQKEVLIGISTSSKVWALEDNKIKYLVEWFQYVARKIGDPEMDNRVSPLSELDSGKVVAEFPNLTPFFADWDAQLYHKSTRIVFIDADNEVADSALVCSCTVKILEYSPDEMSLLIGKGGIVARIKYQIVPRIAFTYADDSEYRIAIRVGDTAFGRPEHFLAILNENPINVYFENLAKLVGKVFFEYSGSINTIADAQIVSHPWPATVNINKEYYTPDDVILNEANNETRLSIHDYIIEIAKQQFDVVFYDHGSLEIADVIGLSNQKIQFYHCKKQDGNEPRVSVDDIYEVCGQAVKSVNWAHRKLLIKQLYDRADQNDSNSKIKKGTLENIKTILDTFDNPILPVVITVVQPGLKTRGLIGQQQSAFGRVKTLLSGADTFLQDVSQCKLQVLCS